MRVYQCIAIAGPRGMVDKIEGLEELFDSVHIIHVPDDFGEFPDTSGYTAEDYSEMQSNMEDPALYKYMQNAMDFIMDKTINKSQFLEGMGMINIENNISWPKFGGKVYVVAGA